MKPYFELGELFSFFQAFAIRPFDDAAATFIEYRKSKVRIGTMDLKIASIAVTSDVLLLTANRADFEKVPGLKFANWLD